MKYDIRPKNFLDTSSKPANGLLSAPIPTSEGVVSSDGEGSSTSKSVRLPRLTYIYYQNPHHLHRAERLRKESNQEVLMLYTHFLLIM